MEIRGDCMTSKNLTSIQGSTVAESMLDLLTKVSQEIRSFDNIRLIEVYDQATNVKRYLNSFKFLIISITSK